MKHWCCLAELHTSTCNPHIAAACLLIKGIGSITADTTAARQCEHGCQSRRRRGLACMENTSTVVWPRFALSLSSDSARSEADLQCIGMKLITATAMHVQLAL